MNPSTDAARDTGWKRAWGALVDANPVLAKELLVTARTPAFVRSMIGVPVALGALVLLSQSGHRFDPVEGRRLFPLYFALLSLVLGIVGATLGSTVLVQEREGGALDALKFSALTPSRIVLGKMAAVVLAEVAVVICTMPLLAYVLALGGVSLRAACVAMSIALACGVMTASVGVAASAHSANARRSLVLSLLGAVYIGIGVTIWLLVGSDLGGLVRSLRGGAGLLRSAMDRFGRRRSVRRPSVRAHHGPVVRPCRSDVRPDRSLRGPESAHQALGGRRLWDGHHGARRVRDDVRGARSRG